ncbi:MAG: hypothetical protein OM95_03365 [Bdellovibrio sp. ArHS]|uniref:hypothetical protein n=1 Tax=Bdellovibrio sp. ArHS TaxID=1569284 RepID=UPI000582825C|nr:hypothetical protein [Bdellovibrio sp. ArHS]KHD89418.1 MAG: hypothetical protein OM95_03365 [Bdellovibrio sp. ArHS]
MDSSVSTLHCSFVIYLHKDAAFIPTFIKDLRSFFQKFPLNYEVVAVIEKNAKEAFNIMKSAQTESSSREHIQILYNDRYLGRAESLRRAFTKSQAPFVLVTDPLLSTPLGDLFKILQNLMTDTSVAMCWGERVSKKDSLFHRRTGPRHSVEHLFTGIFKDIKRGFGSLDPFCEIGGFSKRAWNEIEPHLPKKLNGWYLHPDLHKAFSKSGEKILEIPIWDSGATSLSYGLVKARWNLFAKSLL